MPDLFGNFDRSATALLFGALGQTATLQPASGGSAPVSVLLDQDAPVVGDLDQVIEYRHTLSFRLAECQPGRGDTVVVGADSYRLEGVAAGGDDGVVRKMLALKLAPAVIYLMTADGDYLVTADDDYLAAA